MLAWHAVKYMKSLHPMLALHAIDVWNACMKCSLPMLLNIWTACSQCSLCMPLTSEMRALNARLTCHYFRNDCMKMSVMPVVDGCYGRIDVFYPADHFKTQGCDLHHPVKDYFISLQRGVLAFYGGCIKAQAAIEQDARRYAAPGDVSLSQRGWYWLPVCICTLCLSLS